MHIYIHTIGPPINITVSDITDTSFVVQWDEVDNAVWYIVSWSVKETSTQETSHTITGLAPNTSYGVTVEVADSCGQHSKLSDTVMVTTFMTEPSSLVNSKTAIATPTGN